MNNQSTIAIILTTVSNQQQANTLVHQLLSERMIACATIVPAVESHYWWDEKLTTETEVLLILKTQEARIDVLKERLGLLHPYQVPELIVLRPSDVGQLYATWVQAITTEQSN